MTDNTNNPFEGGRAIELPGGIAGLLAGALLSRFGGGGPLGGGGGDQGNVNDHPLLKAMGVEPPQPFRVATKEEFLAFFEGWEQLKIGDIVEIREDYAPNDQWPRKGERAIVSQVLANPIRRGQAFTEQMGRLNDVALMFMANTDLEVAKAMAEATGEKVEVPSIHEFLYDSRRLKKVGSVFDR